MCVYHFEAKAEERVCAWLARMIYRAIRGLVHDLAVPPRPFQWCRPATEIVTQRGTLCLYSTQTHF